MKTAIYFLAIIITGLASCSQHKSPANGTATGIISEDEPVQTSTARAGDEPLPVPVIEDLNSNKLQDTVIKTEAEWRKILSPEAFYVLREEGTEPAFNNKYNKHKKKGIYACTACGNPMFSSKTKFESGTGWPSFYAPISEKRVKEVQDLALGMVRTEVECARCGSHIGHVFPDGPEPTGLRYCLNSLALNFAAK